VPHASGAVPGEHCPVEEQHPLHELVSHTHTVPVQCKPAAHVPVLHTPPQPSFAPQAAPWQLGVQPQAPGWPPPAQLSRPVQAMHALPPSPHAASLVPATHWSPLQQPVHEAASQRHTPSVQS
jgi:hypothetical protein